MNQKAIPSGPSLPHLAGAGVEDVHVIHLHRTRPPSAGRSVISGSPKMTNRFPWPVFLRSSATCRSALMRALREGCGRACWVVDPCFIASNLAGC
jgi:hypothetical protein